MAHGQLIPASLAPTSPVPPLLRAVSVLPFFPFFLPPPVVYSLLLSSCDMPEVLARPMRIGHECHTLLLPHLVPDNLALLCNILFQTGDKFRPCCFRNIKVLKLHLEFVESGKWKTLFFFSFLNRCMHGIIHGFTFFLPQRGGCMCLRLSTCVYVRGRVCVCLSGGGGGQLLPLRQCQRCTCAQTGERGAASRPNYQECHGDGVSVGDGSGSLRGVAPPRAALLNRAERSGVWASSGGPGNLRQH